MDFSNDLNVTAGGPELKSGGYPYYASTTFNPKTNADYLKYQDKIKSIAAKGFSYQPITLEFPVVVSTGTLKIYTGTLEDPTMMVKWDFTNVTLVNGTKVTLPAPSQGTLADVSTMLDGASDITIVWYGYQSLAVDDYTLSMWIDAEIQAYLLK